VHARIPQNLKVSALTLTESFSTNANPDN
jgi:hypothetical protein